MPLGGVSRNLLYGFKAARSARRARPRLQRRAPTLLSPPRSGPRLRRPRG
jgi:hypothetical protein